MSEVSRGLLSVRSRMKLTGVFPWVAELEEVSEVGVMSAVGRLTTVDGVCDGYCGGGSHNPNPNERDFAPTPLRGDGPPPLPMLLLLPAAAADASFDDSHPISVSAVRVSFFFLVKNFIIAPAGAAETKKIDSENSYPRLQ